MNLDSIIRRVPPVVLIVGGLFFLSAARHALYAELLRQQAQPVIPGHIINLVLACMAAVGLGSFWLGVIQRSKTRD